MSLPVGLNISSRWVGRNQHHRICICSHYAISIYDLFRRNSHILNIQWMDCRIDQYPYSVYTPQDLLYMLLKTILTFLHSRTCSYCTDMGIRPPAHCRQQSL